MRGLEPIVRKAPEKWLPEIASWTSDSSKWVQRAGVTVIGRLPMKKSEYTKDCLEMIRPLLQAQDEVVRKAVSFAIRVSARGQVKEVVKFLQDLIPNNSPETVWIFCDVIRNMTKKFLPEFKVLLPLFMKWSKDPSISSRYQKSIESAVKTLRNN
jgi:3-methyladenine DNA glycosylase AlkD